MVLYEIQAEIEAIEKNAALYEETNFDSRVDALDTIEFNIIDRIEGLLPTTTQPEEWARLKQYAESIKRQLEDIDEKLFQRLRADIRDGLCPAPALKSLIGKYVGCHSSRDRVHDEIGYDSLDEFINGLLLLEAIPTETKVREREMVAYQQTPARIILELIEKAQLTEKDVFYDLGSGLGQVSILVHLLSGALAKGIEFEPAYCAYARMCAAGLNLSGVEFINEDARQADYADGTVFFLYTPFEGRLLQEVLEKLRRVSEQSMMRLFTYGPCTPQVSRQSWLECIDQNEAHIYKLGVFRSL